MALGPAARPCGSCPYRRDVPSGVWHAEEYAKLPLYDQPTYDQPEAAFFCHQQDGHLCAGWVGCHDTTQLLALRLPFHGLSEEELDKTHEYVSPVPLFESGKDAAVHGIREYDNPGPRADTVRRNLLRRLADKGVTT